MRITIKQLRTVIKEEVTRVMTESKVNATPSDLLYYLGWEPSDLDPAEKSAVRRACMLINKGAAVEDVLETLKALSVEKSGNSWAARKNRGADMGFVPGSRKANKAGYTWTKEQEKEGDSKFWANTEDQLRRKYY